jgi:hypothetical protein
VKIRRWAFLVPWKERRNALTLAAALLALTAVLTGAVAVVIPVAPGVPIPGVVERIQFSDTRLGTMANAVVRLAPERTVTISLPYALDCRVGNQVTLIRTPTRFGVRYALADGGVCGP